MAVELDVCERQERLSSRSIHHSVRHSACHDAHDCAADRGGREHRLYRAGAGRDETRAGGGGEGRGRRGAPLVRCGIREWIGVLSPSEAAAIGVPFGHTPPGGPCSVHLHDGPSKDSRVPPTEERAQERSGACIAHVISRVPSVPNTACVQGKCALWGLCWACVGRRGGRCGGRVSGAVSGECASAPSCTAERVRPA